MSAAKPKMPTKAELIQLQKLYRTDEKIGERLGGVPAYLVAYWRRKKGIPKHSVPKFSEKEVRSLWERFGDDDACGLELGISKAAFYNWRRRYGIKEKPAFLKLEQLELSLPGLTPPRKTASLWGEMTIGQKILARAAGAEKVKAHETVEVEPDLVVSHGNTAEIIRGFREGDSELVWNPAKVLVGLSGCTVGEDSGSAETVREIREFAARQRFRSCYDFSEGAAYQVALENGQILPGMLSLGTDQSIAALGCVSGLGLRVSQDTLVEVWSGGLFSVEVPESIRIDIAGRRARGVYAKDIALSLLQRLGPGGAEGRVIEFFGSSVSQMGISERFTLTRMMPALGCVGVTCPYDSATRRYLTGRSATTYAPLAPDKNAIYADIYQTNVEQLTPLLAGPNTLEKVRPVTECEELPVQLIVLGTCTNGRFDDLRIAAEILKGKRVNADCRLLVYPASRTVYLEALKKGLIRILAEAGAIIMPPGCGSGCHPSWAAVGKGERCLSTGAVMDLGGLSADGAEVYLCSPATAAASSLNAAISNPVRFMG